MKLNTITTPLLVAALLATTSSPLLAQHNNEFFNNGALVTIQSGAEVHVWGDVHMQGAGGTLNNNGLLKVQGNMYSDNAFQQRGTGTTLLENSDINTNERQFISGSYAVRGGVAQIGVNDGSFYNLEINNSQGAVYLVNTSGSNVADVRNSINFDPRNLGPTKATNLVTHDIGLTGSPTYPTNGSAYGAVFGMMNDAPGLGNYINDTWHQSGGNNLSLQDHGYIVGKHRRAINPTGGIYGYLIGLDPDVAVANNGNQKGFQYIHFNFGTNNYEVLTGYFEAGSANNSQGAAIECSGYNMDQFWGAAHGEWQFDDINNVTNGGTYEVSVWPQDPSTPWFGTVWTISKDDVFQYPNLPLHNDCGATPTNLDRNGFEDFSAFGVVSGVVLLETEVTSFTATPINNNYITLNWTTDKEINLDRFVIERSTDNANFVPLTVHDAIGNSQTSQYYTIDDHAVLPNINYYYRVKVINNNGTANYTNSVVASLKKEGRIQTINLFPNPLRTGDATIEVTSEMDKDASVVVYDALGKRIMVRSITIQRGLNTYQIQTQDWPSGLYYIHFNSADASTVKELIKMD